MSVQIEMPDISDLPRGFPEYWVKAGAIGAISPNYAINALASTYVRLIEAALRSYRLAEPSLRQFWDSHDSVNVSALNAAVSHFEACISDMHRAIRCFNRLRQHQDTPTYVKADLLKGKPRFSADLIAGRLREVRDTILHLDEKVMKGIVPEGSIFALYPDGPEMPIHGDQPGQTLKRIDRLHIGERGITFVELARWLKEMSDYAQKLSSYTPIDVA